MKRWLVLPLLALLFVPSRPAAQQAPAGRDWKKYPAIVEIDTTQEIYAVGDPHADYDRLVTLLVAAKLIAADPGSPDKAKWTGGKAVLVCTGDMIDKGDQSLRVLALFRTLGEAAAKDSGQVVVTLGNHEAEFLADPAGKKTSEFARELKANQLDPADVAAGKDAAGVGEWLRSRPFGVRVNDYFFSHAGNTHEKTLKQLRADLESGITDKGYKAAILLDDDSLLEARMHPRPWWEKEGDTAAMSKERLAANVKALGVKHLVIGHQPGKLDFVDGSKRRAGEIFSLWDGQLVLIDTGMSRGVGYSTGAVLKIRNGENLKLTAILATGEEKKLLGEP
jgi:hypothetical protein